MLDGPIPEGLTFDDVLLVPNKSAILPTQVDTRTRVTRNITLNIPIVSAAMDTVTESRLAIALAQQGGIGIVHRSMSIAQQALEVDKVKRSESGMIVDPVTIGPKNRIADALEIMKKYKISGVPVTQDRQTGGNPDQPRPALRGAASTCRWKTVMTKDNLITVAMGTTLEEAEEILHQHRVEKLLVVDESYNLRGLITVKDIQKKIKYPQRLQGRARAPAGGRGPGGHRRLPGARGGTGEGQGGPAGGGHRARPFHPRAGGGGEGRRANSPISTWWPATWPRSRARATCCNCGVDGVKVGIGPGSICTTRVVTGAGVPQITAISECARAAAKAGVPIIADGGIKFSGDVSKAIAAGASSVMLGSLFAGTEESPGETILYQGRSFKSYRGMGSIAAMTAGSGDRYSQEREVARGKISKLVPEGIEGRVPYKGLLEELVAQLVGGLRSGMGYCGCTTIEELQQRGRFVRITSAGLRESHVHDVIITKEAPNYSLD